MEEKGTSPFVHSVAIKGDYLICWMQFLELLEVLYSRRIYFFVFLSLLYVFMNGNTGFGEFLDMYENCMDLGAAK